jgi:hypothetical protein
MSRIWYRALPLALLMTGGCSHHQSPAPQPRSGPVLVVERARPSTDPRIRSLIEALPPSAVRLHLVPDSVGLHIGDTLDLRSIRVLVLDSAGTTLGRLPLANMHVTPEAIRLIAGLRIVAVQPGRGEVSLQVPDFQWAGHVGPAPHAVFPVLVSAD